MLVKDTQRIQKASLHLFAQELGYVWCKRRGHYTPRVECCVSATRRGKLVISLLTMQRWHNSSFKTETADYPWHGEDFVPVAAENLGFYCTQIRKAVNAKLVKRTYFIPYLKGDKIKCTKHKIAFA